MGVTDCGGRGYQLSISISILNCFNNHYGLNNLNSLLQKGQTEMTISPTQNPLPLSHQPAPSPSLLHFPACVPAASNHILPLLLHLSKRHPATTTLGNSPVPLPTPLHSPLSKHHTQPKKRGPTTTREPTQAYQFQPPPRRRSPIASSRIVSHSNARPSRRPLPPYVITDQAFSHRVGGSIGVAGWLIVVVVVAACIFDIQMVQMVQTDSTTVCMYSTT